MVKPHIRLYRSSGLMPIYECVFMAYRGFGFSPGQAVQNMYMNRAFGILGGRM